MQAETDVLFVLKQTVGCVPLEVVPDLLDRVEFGGVLWERLDMQPRIVLKQFSDRWTFVDAPLVPKQDDRTAQVAQQLTQELGHVESLEIVLLKTQVKAHVFANRRYGERRQRRDAIMTIAVSNDGRATLRTPGSTTRGNEQEATFIEEDQMGPTSLSFFLSGAIDSVSNARWPRRRAEWRAVRVPGKTNARSAKCARRGGGDTARQTSSGLPKRSSLASRGRWETRRPVRPSGARSAISSVPRLSACTDDRGQAWPLRRRFPPFALPPASEILTKTKRRNARRRPVGSALAPEAQELFAADVLTAWGFHEVSCTINRHLACITFAKLNNQWHRRTFQAAETKLKLSVSELGRALFGNSRMQDVAAQIKLHGQTPRWHCAARNLSNSKRRVAEIASDLACLSNQCRTV